MAARPSADEPQDALGWWLRSPALILFVLVLTAIRIWAGGHSWLSEDEAYYRLWGLHPAAGYYDHPPIIGWWIAAGQALVGDTALGVRLIGILATALGSLALWRTGCLLNGRRAAGWAVLFFNTTILIGIGNLIATPDTPSVFFWGLTLWALAEWLDRGNANWFLAVGLFAGLGLISKYSVLFLGVGIILWLIFTPRARAAFTAWQLWVGGVLAVVITAPVVWWNAGHEWISFTKQFGRAVPYGWTSRFIAEFIGAELGLLNTAIALIVLIGIGIAARALVRRHDETSAAWTLPLLTSVPFFAYLLFHSLHNRVQANWPAPLFPALVLLAAFVAADMDRSDGWLAKAVRVLRAVAVPLGVVLSLVIYVHAVSPLTGTFARKDPTFQLRGWPEVAREIEALSVREGTRWVATSAYGMTGQLAFALHEAGSPLPVFQLDQRLRYAMDPTPDSAVLSAPALYVAVSRRDHSDKLAARFAEVERLATIPRQVRGTVLEKIHIYRIAGARGGARGVFSQDTE
ncbi:glycosyltransferase family 39 protein [Breoghania sp.]|uniref:ArnT family glycosyltransferase n=1 Tax=Breoghania sp. TaxID=2065378 RepID=UPI002622D9D8|nr:glycosyltransferase family 39 protein [Breoghania sp.]MDJ0930194.1 glycosyltransferase family 39 protein [Breoghania sp.]